MGAFHSSLVEKYRDRKYFSMGVYPKESNLWLIMFFLLGYLTVLEGWTVKCPNQMQF